MGKIDIDQDLEFQKKEWSAERVGWMIGLALLLAALAGLFGKGPLSYATRSNGPLQVHWERLCRYNSSIDLKARLENAQGGEEGVQVWIDRTYLEKFEIESILPEPQAMHEEDDRLVVSFKAPPTGTALQVTLQLRPQHAGFFQGSLGEQSSSREVHFEQVIFP